MADYDGPILEIDKLSISFFTQAGEIPAVMDFSCTVMPGEAMGLVGESGCGKSTVALGVMQDLGVNGRIVGGSIKFKGRDLNLMSERELRELRGSEIAMIYQEPMASLNPAMKIGRQLMEVPMIHQGMKKDEAYKLALEMVTKVKLPDPARILGSYPHQLSGGQQQRIVIAMALMSRPALLILDEPTTALDVTVEAGIVELVKELGETTGTSMLFISHNLGLVLEVCDRLCVMYSGEAVETGSIEEVFDHMRHPYTQALFRSIPLPGADKNARPLVAIPGNFPLPHERPPGCNFGPRCDYFEEGRCNAAEIPMETLPDRDRHETRCLRWREIDWNAPIVASKTSEATEPGDVVLAVEDLRKYYEVAASALFTGGEKRVVKANETLSFEAREAETLAIVGESGCGKSTLAKVLMGLETATAGDVKLRNMEISKTEIGDRDTKTVASIQMVFQNPFDTLNPSSTIGAQIIRVLEIFKVGKNHAEREQKMLELLDLVKLPRAFAKRMPRQLSGGQKQRIGIARAFAGDAQVVVADEPVSALDVSVQAAVTDLLMEIQRERRTTMLFISHDLSIVRYLSDRVMVMYLGHVVEIGSTEQVFAPPYHPYTEALLSAVPIADTSVKKKHIVLEGDIPSAMNPPPGCPFQTRCQRKHLVPGNLCDTEVPPLKTLASGHRIKCHLSQEEFDAMEPIIVLSGVAAEQGRPVHSAPSPFFGRKVRPIFGSEMMETAMVFGLFRKGSDAEEVRKFGDVVVVSLNKSAYYADARDSLIKTVGKAVEDSPSGKVVIEMSQVKQFTSGPLGALVVSARKADEKGGRLVLAAAVSGFVGKVLSTATETSANPSYPNVRAALSALSTEAAAAYDKAQQRPGCGRPRGSGAAAPRAGDQRIRKEDRPS